MIEIDETRRASPARRLLLMSPFSPHLDAPMGGPVVIAGLITALSRYERVALLYLRGADERAVDPRVAAVCEMAIEVTRPSRHGMARKGAAALAALQGTPTWVAEWRVPGYETALRSLIERWQPEIAQAEFHLMGQYLPLLGPDRAPVVLTQHEPGTDAIAERRRALNTGGRVLPALEQRAWQQYERRLSERVDAVVTFTERDRQAIRRLCPHLRIEVIPPGVRQPHAALNPVGGGAPALLFFGNYLHAPNVDAALRLGRDIFPLIRQEIPDAVLWLVGDHPPEALHRLASDCIAVPGRADNLGSYMDLASAVITPLRLGGGMRVKVIETLAAGKALIASHLAVAGLDLVDGEHALLAETDEEFASAARRLLQDPVERSNLARRGRAWAQVNLSWDRTARQYVALHEELLAQRARGSREAGS